MALGQSAISLGGTTSSESIALELSLGATATISLNDTVVRALGGKPGASVTIDMLSFRGASSSINVVSAAVNKQNLNIYNEAVAAGWNQTSAFTYTINAGIYVWSDSTSLSALTTGGAFPGGLKIINNGFIMGKGGQGGDVLGAGSPNTGAGGPAMNLTTAVTIDNTSGYIGGGGGGGGGGTSLGGGGGGGAGGGRGGKGHDGVGNVYPLGGAGGAIGQPGAEGPGMYEAGTGKTYGSGGGAGGAGGGLWQYGTTKPPTADTYCGGGGGRIMPGSGGVARTVSTAGQSSVIVAWGGNGGSGGAAGAAGSANSMKGAGGGGGGWGAYGGIGYCMNGSANGNTASAGAAGGNAIIPNGYGITWTGGFPTARVFGGVS